MFPAVTIVAQIPTSITLVSGKNARDHLNRLLTTDISNDSIFTRRESTICNLNGRITSRHIHADYGGQILLMHNESESVSLRNNLTMGIPWNEECQISSGDGAIARLVIYGPDSSDILDSIGIDIADLTSEMWVEFADSMISKIHEGTDFCIYEMLVPVEKTSELQKNLEYHGAEFGSIDSVIAIQAISGILDIAIGTEGKIPFDLGLNNVVDLTKGCYPGQEIHARMESRDAINKTTSTFISKQQLPLGKLQTLSNLKLEVICSKNLDDNWINVIIHQKEMNISEEISIISDENIISIRSV